MKQVALFGGIFRVRVSWQVFCCCWLFHADNSKHCSRCLVEFNRVNLGPNEVTRISCLREFLRYCHRQNLSGQNQIYRRLLTLELWRSSIMADRSGSEYSGCIITRRHQGAVKVAFFSRVKEGGAWRSTSRRRSQVVQLSAVCRPHV